MICYRDMTFCSALCGTEDCPRQFTEEHRLKAEKWWEGCEGGPPVAFSDFSATCPDYVAAAISTKDSEVEA